MNYNTYTLANGLRVIHRHDASPVVFCGYGVNVGSRDEAPDEEGLAHFCEHVTFKGTARRRAWHVLNSLERVGGDLNAFTNKEDTVYYAAIQREHLPRAVDLLSDIVFHSVYPQAEIEKEAEVIADEIESYNDSPAELIYDEFENIDSSKATPGAQHPWRGRLNGSDHLGTADAQRFTGRFYRPENMVFFAYGDIQFDRLVVRLLREGDCRLSRTHPAAPDLEVEGETPWQPSYQLRGRRDRPQHPPGARDGGLPGLRHT